MADSELMQLSKTDRNPLQEARYQSLLTNSGIDFTNQNGRASVDGFGVGGNGADASHFAPGGVAQFAGLTKQQMKFQQEANAPIIQNLEAQKAPLKERYNALLDDLKIREKRQTSTAEISLAREYGRRGIPLSSTDYDKALEETRNPISEYYSNQGRQVNSDQDMALLDLAGRIASVQGQGNQQALMSAMQLLGMQRQNFESDRSFDQQNSQFDQSLGLDRERLNSSNSQFGQTFGENQRQFDANFGLEQARFNRSGSGGGGLSTSDYKGQVLSDAKNRTTLSSLVSKYGNVLPVKDIVGLYAATSPHGVPKEPWAKELLGLNSGNQRESLYDPQQ